MEIKLQLFSILREKLPKDKKGQTVLQMKEGATIADLLEEIGINRRVAISVNGLHETDKSLQLKDGDKVKIFSSVSGG